LPVGICQVQALKRSVITDNRVQQVMPRRRGNQGADGPDNAELEPSICVERIRQASRLFSLPTGIGSGGRAVGRSSFRLSGPCRRLGRDRRGAEDDAAAEGGAEVGLPLKEHAVVNAELARGQLDVKAPQLPEGAEHLGGRVVGDVRDGRGRRGSGQWLGAPGDGRRGGGEDLAERVDGPSDAAEQGARDARERAAPARGWRRRLVRRGARCGARGGGRGWVVGDDAVDADEDGVDERHERVEAARDEGAAAERLDVADAVEDVEQHRVVEPLEVVRGLGPAARAPLLLLLLLLLLLPPRRRLHPTQGAGAQIGIGERRRRGAERGTGGRGATFLGDLIGFPCALR
jgi:hypothetical protein